MKKRLPFENKLLQQSLAVYLKQYYSIDIWRGFAKNFPSIIDKESELKFFDELDSFSIRYKTIIQEHKSSSMSIIRRWKLLSSDFPHLSR